MLFFGGVGYVDETKSATLSETHDTKVLDDFWQFNINVCNNNCSMNGVCSYGDCICDPGFYGIDCSNSTCPGDYCFYDEFTNEQVSEWRGGRASAASERGSCVNQPSAAES